MTKKKKTAPKPKAPKAEAEAQLSRFQTFTMRRIHRRDIRNFARNPRTITDAARKTLKRNLDVDKGGVGLLAPITWNEVTRNITGGHQRLAALDALEGSDIYLLDVAVVHLTEVEEIQANILLNNGAAQGAWDADLLADLFKTPDLDLDATGFTPLDLSLSFDDPELSALFQPNEATASLVGEFAGIKADAAEQKKATKSGSSSSSSGAAGDDDGDAADIGDRDTKPDNAERAKAFRKRGKEVFDSMDDTEVMACVVFKSREERENFMERFGLEREERYIDGSRVVARLADS
jgi:hypothetical protein